MATGNLHQQFCENRSMQRFQRYARGQTDRQTDPQTDRQTNWSQYSAPLPGGVTN